MDPSSAEHAARAEARRRLEEEAIAANVEKMIAAERIGGDPMKAAEAAFPGTPIGVLASAYGEFIERDENAWWERLQKIIEGESLKRAMLKAGQGPSR